MGSSVAGRHRHRRASSVVVNHGATNCSGYIGLTEGGPTQPPGPAGIGDQTTPRIPPAWLWALAGYSRHWPRPSIVGRPPLANETALSSGFRCVRAGSDRAPYHAMPCLSPSSHLCSAAAARTRHQAGGGAGRPSPRGGMWGQIEQPHVKLVGVCGEPAGRNGRVHVRRGVVGCSHSRFPGPTCHFPAQRAELDDDDDS